jgi:hypothetical protein
MQNLNFKTLSKRLIGATQDLMEQRQWAFTQQNQNGKKPYNLS